MVYATPSPDQKNEDILSIKPAMREEIRLATTVAYETAKLFSLKLDSGDQIMRALRDAQKPKNITGVQTLRSLDEKIYTMKISLAGGEERVLTMRTAPQSFEVMLTDATGKLMEYVKQEGNKLNIQRTV